MIHISNLYGINLSGNNYENQQYIAKIGRELGINELGLFLYPVDTDTEQELGKRIDGITSSVQRGDTVILQFPTENGSKYENTLIKKIRGRRDTRVIVMLTDSTHYEDLSWLFCDLLVATSADILSDALKKGIHPDAQITAGMNRRISDTIIKKNLLEAVSLVGMHDYVQNPVQDTEYIHVAFGLHDKTGTYSSFVGTTMLSLLEHTSSSICIHIFCDDTVSIHNKDLLSLLAANYGALAQFHIVEPDEFNVKNDFLQHYSIGSLFRLIIPRTLPNISRIIYLDADLMIEHDIKELWNTDLQECSLGAVHDIGFENGISRPDIVRDGSVAKEKYFNSGVLLMDLDKIRAKGDLLQLSLDYFSKHPESEMPDQDALNYLFKDETMLLDPEWNCFTRYERKPETALGKAKIYHFMGQRHINFYAPTEFDKKYMEYRQKTPWGYGPVATDLFRGLNTLRDKVDMLQGALTKIAQKSVNKVYIGHRSLSMTSLMNILPPQDGDFCICTESEMSSMKRYGLPCKSISELQFLHKDKYIFFVLPEEADGKALEILNASGLTSGTDYFVIPRLLNSAQGGYWA